MAQPLSRRSFLQGSALATAGATVFGAASVMMESAEAGQSTGLPVIGPGMITMTLEVNGERRAVQVEPRMTLAEALRGPLALTGTKIACNRGACSACTVWLDGVTVCSCMMLALDVGTRRVTTIEGDGLATDEARVGRMTALRSRRTYDEDDRCSAPAARTSQCPRN